MEKSAKEKFQKLLRNKLFLSTLIGGGLFWMVVISYFSEHYTVGVNLTPSLPYRFIVIKNGFVEKDLEREKIIGFRFGFDSKYDYYKKDTLFAKRLQCMPGDTLETNGRMHFCNGKPLGSALLFDSKKRPVTEFFDFNGTVPEGKYYVQGDHTHSYDSRYWGFIDKSQIIGAMTWAH